MLSRGCGRGGRGRQLGDIHNEPRWPTDAGGHLAVRIRHAHIPGRLRSQSHVLGAQRAPECICPGLRWAALQPRHQAARHVSRHAVACMRCSCWLSCQACKKLPVAYDIPAREAKSWSKQDSSVRQPHSPEPAAAMDDMHWDGCLEDDWCRASRFGNPSETHLSDLHLDIRAEGPGPLEHSWHHGEARSLCLQISAELAGECCGLSGDMQTVRRVCTLGCLVSLKDCARCKTCARARQTWESARQ